MTDRGRDKEKRQKGQVPPLRLDAANAQVWQGEHLLKLTPKAFAVLQHLLDHAGRLVTKDELMQTVWADTVVTDGALVACMRELRKALGDDAQAPHYIETVHRRGYRFLVQLSNLHGQTTAATETVYQQRAEGGREVERKLVAILSADVQGYSRLMSADEVATVRTLTGYRAVLTTLIRRHHGRVVDAPGDNLLAEFASVVDAVEGAVAMQRALAERNAALLPERRMAFRIGINVGDVVVEGERIYGDGVNIAARLEGLAEAGGLCISGTVYDQIKNKVDLIYEDLGERTVKNIVEPVRVYRVRWESEGRAAPAPATRQPVASSQYAVVSREEETQEAKVGFPSPAPSTQHPAPPLVGRDAELAQLHRWLEKALGGERQLIFVGGEPGIGKTTLVDAFRRRLEAGDWRLAPSPQASSLKPLVPSVWLGWGQCIEQYGAGEAYLPVLEALGRLCRGPDSERLIALLTQHAPTWLVQMPALLSAPEHDALQRKTQGATRERMLRELAEALEVISAERPFILVLEDLHWSDPSTLDLLSILARRPEPARLLIIGTYRPVDVIVREHPLKTVKAELQLHHHCQELALEPLSEAQVGEYLAQRWAEPSRHRQGAERQTEIETEGRQNQPLAYARGSDTLRTLARLLHQRTEGNPLFVVSMVNDLMACGMVVQTDTDWELREDAVALESRIPDTIRQLVTLQGERLSLETQHTLAAASIAGLEFSAASVAAALATETVEVERQCESLATRQQFLQRLGVEEWPDGTLAARYGFLHAVYQQVWHERVSPTQLQHYHRQIGARKEQAYGERVREIAAELAIHFEQGREYRKAVQYLRQVGQNAIRHSAYQEATSHLTKGLELLKLLPDTPERVQQELRLQMMLTTPLIVLRGYTDPEVEHACVRARALCEQVGENPQLFAVLGGLFSLHYNRGQLRTALELAQQLLRLAQATQDRRLLLWAHYILGLTLEDQGDRLSARTHFEQSLALYDPHQPPSAYGFAQDPGTTGLARLAWILYSLGYPTQALKKIHEALSLARQLAHPFSLAYVLLYAAEIHQGRGEHHAAQELEEELFTLSHEQGFSYWSTEGAIRRAWTLTRQGQREEGLAQLRQAVARLQTRGDEIALPYALYRLADAYGHAGKPEEGLRIVAKGFVVARGQGRILWEASFYHQKGELTLQLGAGDWGLGAGSSSPQVPSLKPQVPSGVEQEAEECFLKAIELARQQQARSDELEMGISLARLWQQQGKKKQAHKMLSEIYNWFTEGFDTKYLQEAKALLRELSH